MGETESSEKNSRHPQRVFDLTDDYNEMMGIEPVDEVIAAIEFIARMQKRHWGGPKKQEQSAIQNQEEKSDTAGLNEIDP